MIYRKWTRRSLTTALAAAGLFAMPAAGRAQGMSVVAWQLITNSALTIADAIRRRSDSVAAALASGGGDSGFTSVFGAGGGSPAERKRRTLATARELDQIAFDERTQLLSTFDAYLAEPTQAQWLAVQENITGISARLHDVERRLDRLGATGWSTTTGAEAVVGGKVQMLEAQARERRPTTPAELETFRRFRNAFAALVDEKARLAEQLARLGATM